MSRFCINTCDVAAVVDAAKEELKRTGELPELEVRLGSMTPSGFSPGMPIDVFAHLEEQFDTFRDWNTVSDVWRLIHTYYHGSSIPHDKRQLRTDLVFKSEVETVKTTMEKSRIATATFCVEGSTAACPVDFRIALSSERAIPPRDIPNAAVPYHCVIKLRKEYTYSPADYAEPVMAFHFTKRWTGDTYMETVAKVCNPPQCDLEIELLSADYLSDKSSQEIAFKIMWKLYSVIVEMRRGNPDTDVVVVTALSPRG